VGALPSAMPYIYSKTIKLVTANDWELKIPLTSSKIYSIDFPPLQDCKHELNDIRTNNTLFNATKFKF
jgi:hypothetical protein